MHISVDYGQVKQRVQDLSLPGLDSPADSWSEGVRQKELNERGAYIHRFHDQNSINSVVAAVKKIAEDSICTPCTLLGPSLCRSYNHHVWEGCAALIFSPSMHIALAYKGDIYSNRLYGKSNLNHDQFKQAERTRPESVRLFADAVCTEFNKLGPTTSAFKGRRTKQLNLVVSAQYHAAKIQELEKRADLYFRPDEHVSEYRLDVSSKHLIMELCEKHLDFQLSEKPNLETKAQTIEFIDTVLQVKPDLAPFLRAAKIKISSFENDSAIPAYLAKAKNDTKKLPYQRSYVEFLNWQFRNAQSSPSLNSSFDKSTTLTPNEVLGMPIVEDLVGLLIDPSSVKSFDQALATLKHLNDSGLSSWATVAQGIPPYTHLISHLNQGTLIQLGWSKMIIPYSTEGLKEFCGTGKVRSINGFDVKPDYFLLLHRIASSGVLVFAPDHQIVDILQIKPNVVTNFSSISSNRGNPLLYEAVECDNIDADTLRLLCHLHRLETGSFEKLEVAAGNPLAVNKHLETLSELIFLRDSEVREDLNDLLTRQIDRIEQLHQKRSCNFRTTSYRGGIQDQGVFSFNSKLGSLSLIEGTRSSIDGSQLIGWFKHTASMKQGGAQLTFGKKDNGQEIKFGNFEADNSFCSIHELTNAKGSRYFRLRLGQGTPSAHIDFSYDQFARLYIILETKILKQAISTQFRNHEWTENLDQVTKHPLLALRFISEAIQAPNEVPDERLANMIICLSALRNKVSLQLQPAMDFIARHGTSIQMQHPSTRELELRFHRLLIHIDKRLTNLMALYGRAYPNHDELISKLEQLDNSSGEVIKSHLTSKFDVKLNRPQPPDVNTLPPTSQTVNRTAISPAITNKNPLTIKKLTSLIKTVFRMLY